MLEPFGIVTNATKLARPWSRRTTTNRLHSEAAAPLPGAGEESPERTGQSIRLAAEQRILSTTEVTGFELTNALSLWGQLVLQQIRPRLRSRRRAEQGVGDPPQNRRRSASEAHSSRTGPAGLRPQEEIILPAVETLFTQLAQRRLPRGATQETRG